LPANSRRTSSTSGRRPRKTTHDKRNHSLSTAIHPLSIPPLRPFRRSARFLSILRNDHPHTVSPVFVC
jgi:hypothetical protein